jgi:hypothetical protein
MRGTEIIPFKEPRALAGLAAKLPPLFLPDEKAEERFFQFFTAHLDEAAVNTFAAPPPTRTPVAAHT